MYMNDKPFKCCSVLTVEPHRESRGVWVGRDQPVNLYACMHTHGQGQWGYEGLGEEGGWELAGRG